MHLLVSKSSTYELLGSGLRFVHETSLPVTWRLSCFPASAHAAELKAVQWRPEPSVHHTNAARVLITGLIGTAPSKELLEIWNTRERALVEEGENAITLGGVLHTRPLANLPTPKGACLGKVQHLTETRLLQTWHNVLKRRSPHLSFKTLPPLICETF
jgi:hypothetical protein